MDEEEKAVLARVWGRVQGVGFRWWTKDEADALGLSGWVRNEADGSVSALVAGPPGAVEAMLVRLSKGPAAARVDGVESAAAEARPLPRGFQVRR